jgi:hypothetical protein
MAALAGRTWFWLLALGVCSVGCKREPERTQKASERQQVGHACEAGLRCLSPNSAMACVQGLEKRIECRGPGGCEKLGDHATCDNALARTGDVCDEEHDFACALDRKAGLECQAGQFRSVEAYAGIEGCSLKGDEITCGKGTEPSCDDIEDIACCLSFARRPKAH